MSFLEECYKELGIVKGYDLGKETVAEFVIARVKDKIKERKQNYIIAGNDNISDQEHEYRIKEDDDILKSLE